MLTTDDKYYLLNRDNLKQLIQIQLFEKKKEKFYSAFLKSISKLFEFFFLKMTLKAYVYRQFRTAKEVLR